MSRGDTILWSQKKTTASPKTCRHQSGASRELEALKKPAADNPGHT